MIDTVLAHEPSIRLSVFAGVLIIMALWEFAASRRPQQYRRWQRWPHNLMIVAIGALAVRLVFPFVAVGAAFIAQEQHWGLFNVMSAPLWLAVVASFIALDVVIYFQHRLFHAVPWLWRLHRMHHADLEFDVTTGLRFHPLEIVISMALKLIAVVALGAPPVAVLIFEVLLNATAMFNHANARLPVRLDRWLRWIVVTPDMHRVHHSIIRRETDSNFGFNLPWWDHLFGTYRDQPAEGHLGMTIGLERFRTARDLRLDKLLIQPFLRDGEAFAKHDSP